MLLGKRKEKFIRDMVLLGSGLASDMFDLLEKWLDAKAHLDEKIHREGTDRIVEALENTPRETLEREEVERIVAIVVEAIQADMIEWRQVTISPDSESRKHIKRAEMMKAYGYLGPEPSSPVAPNWDQTFGDIENGLGRLTIERTGVRRADFALLARLPDADSDLPHVFKQGNLGECMSVWDMAVDWMYERFPDLPSDEPVEPKPPYPESYKLFGTPETGHGRLILEPDGGDDRFTLTAYLPEGMDTSSHLFLRGTRAECETAWPEAYEWMEKRFPENKA